jgi:DNA polymerase (family 10)
MPIVDGILADLREVPGLRDTTPVGSLRRFQETVSVVDLVGTADSVEDAIQAFVALPQVEETLASGTNWVSAVVSGGLQVSLRVVDHNSFGSALQHFTGSEQHNINLRDRARRQGLSLSEYGITSLATGELEQFTTEEALYQRLGLQYVPPEIREGQQEIEKAARGDIPDLVELADIRGELHVHTRWSDGRNTIEEMALAARARGYQYLGIADHSSGTRIAHGQGLKQQTQEIRQLNQKLDGIHILSGVEANVMLDGSLDVPDEILAEMDFVIASVHRRLGLPRRRMTERIITAMENPRVDVLAHPTSRRVMPVPEWIESGPADVDMEAVLQTAIRTHTVLEINSMPSRLDLNDTHAGRARELGVGLMIDTDSHAAEKLRAISFGVGVARRAWCQASDILNAKPLDEFVTFLKSRGQDRGG